MKHWRLVYLIIPLTFAAVAITCAANDRKAGEIPAEGVGRVPTVERYLAAETEHEHFTIEEYREGDFPVPGWWKPDEDMAVEWTDPNTRQSDSNTIQRTDIGCPDYNYETTLYGWNGHTAEPWELDLLARIFYLEFWGTSLPCSEAGCDAILNLWDTGNYGRTLFDALSYYDPQYGYTYRVYPRVWETNYDVEGLEWCREFTAERFYNGTEWGAVYFQLGGFHDTDWVPPLYEIDGVYFSGSGR